MKTKLFFLIAALTILSCPIDAQIKIHGSGGISIGSETDPNANQIVFDKQTVFNASISNLPSNLMPATPNVYDLGSSSLAWKKLYVNDISVSNGFPNIIPTTSGNNLGGSSSRWKLYGTDMNLSGSANINGFTLTGSTYNLKIQRSGGGYLEIAPTTGGDISFLTDSDFFFFSGYIITSYVIETSDITLKENIVKINEQGSSVEKLGMLEGIQYNLIDDKNKAALVGFSAQEVQKVIPEIVKEDNKGKLGINYTGLIPHLVEALKEHEARIVELESQLKNLEASSSR